MPIFVYKAIDSEGKITDGSQMAESKEQMMQILRARNQSPIMVEASSRLRDNAIKFNLGKVKTKDIAIFCRQFYTMYKAGVPIISCVDTISQQTENKKLAAALREVYNDLQEGVNFPEALRYHPKAFPDLLCYMVEAGDISGNLEAIMMRMAQHYEKENKINSKVKGAMMYPIIISIVLVAVVVVMLVFVMPTFLSMFDESGQELPGLTLALISVSDTVRQYWYIIAAVIGALIYIGSRVSSSTQGKLFFDRVKLKIPYFSKITAKIITSRFSRTLATLLSSAVPLMQALEIVSKVVGNKVVQDGIMLAREHVSKGVNLSSPIKDIGVFPPMMISMIKIGEDSGALDELLGQTADFYDEEVETAMQAMTTIIEPIMIVAMAGVVGTIVVAMMLPMFDMLGAIEGSV